jgi:V/A-type H+-transporting ATPase subunit E
MDPSRLREAILDKARAEADGILADAEAKAGEMVGKARDQFKEKTEAEKKKLLSEARRESARRLAQASLEGRQAVLREKDRIIGEILEKVRERLRKSSMEKGALHALVRQTLDAFQSDVPVRLFTTPRDLPTLEAILKEDGDLGKRVLEVREREGLGGVLAETENGMVSIDNTFEIRLSMLMPGIMPEMAKRLFGEGEH